MNLNETEPIVNSTMIEFTDEERYKNFKDCGIAYDGKCSRCGSAVFKSDKFCANCGTALRELSNTPATCDNIETFNVLKRHVLGNIVVNIETLEQADTIIKALNCNNRRWIKNWNNYESDTCFHITYDDVYKFKGYGSVDFFESENHCIYRFEDFMNMYTSKTLDKFILAFVEATKHLSK